MGRDYPLPRGWSAKASISREREKSEKNSTFRARRCTCKALRAEGKTLELSKKVSRVLKAFSLKQNGEGGRRGSAGI